MKKMLLFSIASALVITLASCAQPTPPPAPEEEYDIKTDASGTKYIVNPAKIVGGAGRPRTVFPQ